MSRWNRVATFLGAVAGSTLVMVRRGPGGRQTELQDNGCDVSLSGKILYRSSADCESVKATGKVLDGTNDSGRNGIVYDDAKHSNQKSCADRQLKKKIRQLLRQVKEEYGIPGLVCAISIDGRLVFVEGLGYSDVENSIKCSEDTVMRLASISKALTSIAVGKLLQENQIDLDSTVQEYIPDFPRKEVNGKEVVITLHHLISHMSGIRHYEEREKHDETSHKKSESSKVTKEWDHKEYYGKNHFKNIKRSLQLFDKDPLRFEPGADFLYSTFGYILLSAIIDKVTEKGYLRYMDDIFKDLGVSSIVPEFNGTITKHRARHYFRNENGRLVNSPYVDNSYKWAGGGFLGNVKDLIKVGNALLYSYQSKSSAKGYLRADVMKKLWTPVTGTLGKADKHVKDVGYGLGWLIRRDKRDFTGSNSLPLTVYHTGGAVGGSSVLMIVPKEYPSKRDQLETVESSPTGTVIAIIANLQNVQLSQVAFEMSKYIIETRKTTQWREHSVW